jgi:nitrate reductase alpha subunit
MSYFLDRLQFFKRDPRPLPMATALPRARTATGKTPTAPLAARQDRALHPRRELHRLLLVEDLRQERPRHLGNPADRLPAHPPDLPNHEPRGCPRGASYSWYLYSANRLKYPLIRGTLLRCGAKRARARPRSMPGPASWRTRRRRAYKTRAAWAASCAAVGRGQRDHRRGQPYTIKQYGPDRVVGFSPIPAMSMVSYAAGARYLSLLGGVCLSFYDWYCDLPPASRRSGASRPTCPNRPTGTTAATSSPGARTCRRRARPTRTSSPRRATRAPRRWRSARLFRAGQAGRPLAAPKQGTDAALAMAMGHVILREFHLDKPSRISRTTAAATPTCRCWCAWSARWPPGAGPLPARQRLGGLGEANNPDWKTLAYDENSGQIVVPNGSIGFRWGEKGVEPRREGKQGRRYAPAPEPGRGQRRHRGSELPVLRWHRAMAGPLHRPKKC